MVPFFVLFVLSLLLRKSLTIPGTTMSHDMTNADDQNTLKKLDLQVRFCFLFHIFFKPLKVINFKKHFNNEEELKRTQVMFFYELCYMSVIEILPSITEHFLFMLTYKIEKMINQAENP